MLPKFPSKTTGGSKRLSESEENFALGQTVAVAADNDVRFHRRWNRWRYKICHNSDSSRGNRSAGDRGCCKLQDLQLEQAKVIRFLWIVSESSWNICSVLRCSVDNLFSRVNPCLTAVEANSVYHLSE
uniref:Uncharacterized protein n=1 Tax=Parascaris univalens TaxID=6257 RepID=A0A915A1H0_PARUN